MSGYQFSEGGRGDSKARGLHASILKLDFIIKSVVFQKVFQHREILSVQSNLDYPDLDYPDFSIIRTLFSGPNFA